jgi:hypothetical protein
MFYSHSRCQQEGGQLVRHTTKRASTEMKISGYRIALNSHQPTYDQLVPYHQTIHQLN